VRPKAATVGFHEKDPAAAAYKSQSDMAVKKKERATKVPSAMICMDALNQQEPLSVFDRLNRPKSSKDVTHATKGSTKS